MAITAEYVDNVFVRSANPKRLIEFYTKNFNLPVVYSADGVTRLQVGARADAAMLAIVDESTIVGGKLSFLSFNVKNIEEAYGAAEKLNLNVQCDTQIRSFGANNRYHYFNLKDPDGNIITAVQPT